MLAECTVVSESILSLPSLALTCSIAQCIVIYRLTYFKTTRSEVLVELVILIVSETAVELEALYDICDFETCSCPELSSSVITVVCKSEPEMED